MRWDLNPSSKMPRTGRRRQRTLGEQFAAGIELEHPEQAPIIFEYPNVEKGRVEYFAIFGKLVFAITSQITYEAER